MTSRDKVQFFLFTICEKVQQEAADVYLQSLNFTST